MKNFVEKIKDFLYDATDYLLILVIIVGVAVVIGWRLDILFAKDMDNLDTANEKPPITDIVEKENNDDKENISDDDIENNNTDVDTDSGHNDTEQIDNNNDNNEDIDAEPNTDTEPKEKEIVTVKVPSGSLPPTIANLLLEKGLIDNKMDFLIRSQELGLDTKLKSGEFNIEKGIALDELIKILAK